MMKNIFLCLMFLMPLGLTAQITSKMLTEESCNPGGDGSATVILPADLVPLTTVEWSTPKGTKLTGRTITGMKAGAYSVVVYSNDCHKAIYQDVVLIERNEGCRINVSIGVSSPSVPCNTQPSATLTATAHGGVGNLSYSWGSNTMSTASSGTYGVTVTDSAGNVGSAKVSVSLTMVRCSEDPNEIDGPLGYESARYVSAASPMRYKIMFENDPNFAFAPASRVRVTYPIPPQHNIASVRLADFGFGSFVFNVPAGTTNYTKRLDVSDSLGVWVDVTAGIDALNNQLFWNFQSVDPATGFEPANSQLGFLLVNDSLGHGEGYVAFSITPKSSVASADTVAAVAEIVFDDNNSINTNVWVNTFDAVAPTSTLAALIDVTDSTAARFTFTATDDPQGCGVDNVELLVSIDDAPYTSVGYYSPSDTVGYRMEEGHLYRFISRATDHVGNQEPLKSQADTSFNYNTAPFDLILSHAGFAENAPVGTLIGTLSTVDNDVTLPFVYDLVSGSGSDHNHLFRISGNKLLTNASFSCTGVFEYSVRIRTTDITGLSFEKEFIIQCIQENYPYSITYNQGICQGSSYTFGSRLLDSTGVYTDSLLTVRGCDSIVTINLTVHPTYHYNQTQHICEGQSFSWVGHDITNDSLTSDIYAFTDNLRTQQGCDSLFGLTLHVHPNYSTSQEAVICDNMGYTWLDHGYSPIYRPAGSHIIYDSVRSTFGCDSVFVLALTVNPTHSQVESVTACDSYTWHGTTYTASTTEPTVVNPNIYGCDSVRHLLLTINPSSHNVSVQQACDSYSWHSVAHTVGGTYTYDYTNNAGCASTDTLHLTVNYSTTGIESITACDAYTWHGTPYVASTNEPIYHTTNVTGCDSTVTLHLTINSSTHLVDTISACDSYTWHGTAYTATSTYTYPYTNAVGCASVDTLRLTVNPSTHNSFTIDACENYTWHGNNYATSGLYTHNYLNTFGCASTDTLHLAISNHIDTTYHIVACDGYNWNGQQYTTSGVYTFDHSTQGSACTNVDTLYLTINASTTIVDNVVACDAYTWHGTTYTTSTTTPTFSATNAAGCDSIVSLHLTINNSTSGTDVQTACDSYTWHGNTYTASATDTYATTNAAGCDSTATLLLTINYSSTSTEAQTACDSYTWHGTTYTASATDTYTTTNAAGCDSTATLLLTINYSSTSTEAQTACDSYTWNGTTYTASTTDTYVTTNAAGCDSTATLALTVNYSSTGVDNQVACDSYTWHGVEYTASTTEPTFTTQNAAGCDSTVTLHLTVNYSTSAIDEQVACDSYTWHGVEYTASTTEPTYTTQNAAGCDSTVTLHLTVNYSVHEVIVDSAVGTYEWNGVTYTESGEYTYTGVTSDGCDSVVVLRLTILQPQGINDVLLQQVSVYPNPTSGKLTIGAAGVLRVEIFDYTGRIVATYVGADQFDISHLSAGTYTLRITLPQGNIIRRVIKR